jgi:hypothetical protein
VVSLTETLWTEPLPPSASSQLAELIALTNTLQLSEGKTAKYAFLVLHAHEALWKERGLLTIEGFPCQIFLGNLKPLKSSFSSKANSCNPLPWTSKVRGPGC